MSAMRWVSVCVQDANGKAGTDLGSKPAPQSLPKGNGKGGRNRRAEAAGGSATEQAANSRLARSLPADQRSGMDTRKKRKAGGSTGGHVHEVRQQQGESPTLFTLPSGFICNFS